MGIDICDARKYLTPSEKSGFQIEVEDQTPGRDVFPQKQCHSYLGDLFPGRKDQIEDLLRIIGEPVDTFPPLLIYGGAATGKTSVIRETMSALQRPFAYVSCRSCHNPRLLFESILNQLLGHVRCRANNYGSAKKCERMTEFVTELVEACRIACARTRSYRSLGTEFGETASRVVYLIFDDVDLIRGWTGGSMVLSSLVTLSNLTGLPNLGLILVSNAGPDTLQLSTSSREPLPLYFRDYTTEELHSILVKWQPNSELFSFFFKASLAPFSRVSRILTELSEGLNPLFEKYCEPVLHGKVKPNGQGRRELFTYVKDHMQPALAETFSIADPDCTGGGFNENRKGSLKRSMSSTAMEFHLSLCSKYLLLASYIGSRNPSTLDDALFGTGDDVKANRRKRKRVT